MSKLSRIAVVGGTGFTGANVVKEAVSRGHKVTSNDRSPPADDSRVGGVGYRVADIAAQNVRDEIVDEVDVVFLAVSPRGKITGHLVDLYADVARAAMASSVRVGVSGGFTALRLSEHGPRIAKGEWPEGLAPIKREGLEMAAVVGRFPPRLIGST